MGAGYSSHCISLPAPTTTTSLPTNPVLSSKPKPSSITKPFLQNPIKTMSGFSLPPSLFPMKCVKAAEEIKTQEEITTKPVYDPHTIQPDLLQRLIYDSLVWSSLHGLLVGDKSVKRSGTVPGVGMVHAPFALLPMSFPESHWRQACDLAPIFNELVDCVSLDAEFIQETLSRTKKVDTFTSRLLDIHSKMVQINKKEDIRLGLHRSDYMLDGQTKLLIQIELNTISSSFPGLSCLVSELHRSLLNHYGKVLGLDSRKVPGNSAVSRYADALARAWTEYNNPRAIILIVVQNEEWNMYDQHWLSTLLKERHEVTTVRKTLAEIDEEGELLADGTLLIGGREVAVVYFRAGYAPSDYPSESEWQARLLMEQSSAIKCPSISYHLAGTKKIQQELAKPNVLERFTVQVVLEIRSWCGVKARIRINCVGNMC